MCPSFDAGTSCPPGLCTPEVLTTSSLYGQLKAVAVGETSVYFATSTEIRRVPKIGGTSTVFVSDDSVQDLAVDATHLYWS
ncbi:MAG TPA: hypothetical protein VND93_32425, partial [Myxococcales bacterium]|nr:hypothetical protein [Myxococcales bacterium]